MVKAPQNLPNLCSCSSSLSSPRLKNSNSRCKVEWRYRCHRPVSTYPSRWCRPWRSSLSYLATAVHATAPPPLPLIDAQNLKDKNCPTSSIASSSCFQFIPAKRPHCSSILLHSRTSARPRRGRLSSLPSLHSPTFVYYLQSLRDCQGDHAFQSSSLQ